MTFIFLFFVLLFFIWAILLYIRKSQWDTVHRNLLDLEDHFEGKVIRRGFAARPFFHGRVQGHSFTLNISSEKVNNQRLNYIDISWDLPVKEALTIADFEWLKQRRDKDAKELMLVKSEHGKEFALIHQDQNRLTQIMQRPIVQKFITQFENLCYVFLGKSGLICEFSTENLARATEFNHLSQKLELLKQLGEDFKR